MDSLEYIDAYFAGGFSAEEVSLFEQRLKDDPEFANEVADYVVTRATLKEIRSEERFARFGEIYRQQTATAKISRLLPGRWMQVLAAASVLVAAALCWLLFFRPATPSRVADRWIGENLVHLSIKMGGTDSIQTGLSLYNSGRFPEALQRFESILGRDSLNLIALLDAGIVSLRMGNYDQALNLFTILTSHTDPSLNPGLFFEALTRLKRNRDGDADLGKQILTRIVRQSLDKKEDANKLLSEL